MQHYGLRSITLIWLYTVHGKEFPKHEQIFLIFNSHIGANPALKLDNQREKSMGERENFKFQSIPNFRSQMHGTQKPRNRFKFWSVPTCYIDSVSPIPAMNTTQKREFREECEKENVIKGREQRGFRYFPWVWVFVCSWGWRNGSA